MKEANLISKNLELKKALKIMVAKNIQLTNYVKALRAENQEYIIKSLDALDPLTRNKYNNNV